MNWQFLLLIYIFVMGIQGFLVKVMAGHLDYKTNITVIWGTAFLCMIFMVFKDANFHITKWHGWALLPGGLAAIGTVILYRALSVAPASRVIPLAHQSVLIAVILSIIFLGEKVTLKTGAGIGLGAGAIVLLMGGIK